MPDWAHISKLFRQQIVVHKPFKHLWALTWYGRAYSKHLYGLCCDIYFESAMAYQPV